MKHLGIKASDQGHIHRVFYPCDRPIRHTFLTCELFKYVHVKWCAKIPTSFCASLYLIYWWCRVCPWGSAVVLPGHCVNLIWASLTSPSNYLMPLCVRPHLGDAWLLCLRWRTVRSVTYINTVKLWEQWANVRAYSSHAGLSSVFDTVDIDKSPQVVHSVSLFSSSLAVSSLWPHWFQFPSSVASKLEFTTSDGASKSLPTGFVLLGIHLTHKDGACWCCWLDQCTCLVEISSMCLNMSGEIWQYKCLWGTKPAANIFFCSKYHKS